ncbi:MAG: glutathione S-transferase C-terminal domain-containing protein, partial [Stenotrophomonas sp.]|nr:glutathione S-transferase C-terminal domain-containing protein [Stenotrophomonas sp.]
RHGRVGEARVEVVEEQLQQGDYLLGERLSAADFLWGSALGWMSGFGLLQPGPATAAYIARMAAHPAVLRGKALDAGLAAA